MNNINLCIFFIIINELLIGYFYISQNGFKIIPIIKISSIVFHFINVLFAVLLYFYGLPAIIVHCIFTVIIIFNIRNGCFADFWNIGISFKKKEV
jgi:TRAP-type C4-dicarboxylate transport system permease small subunit